MIDAKQIRAARALLDLSQADLAEIASVHVVTIRRIEAATQIRGAADTFWKIQSTLEKAGVEFIPEDDLKGPGVRIKESTRSKARRKSRGSG